MSWRLGAWALFMAGTAAALAVQVVVRVCWLHWMPRRALIPIERVLIAARGRDLFDADHYLACNRDVAEACTSALGHYLAFGWRENRPPNRHFDNDMYRAQSGLILQVPVSPLAHFLAIGRAKGLAPVPAADAESLGRADPALEIARMDGYGGLVNGTVRPQAEGRPELESVLFAFAELPVRTPRAASVNVIMPVYKGRAETLNALVHVLTARNRLAAEIVVIDDATPDRALAADLDWLAARGQITLIRSARNQGFPASINRGMALHADRDVIWLNADTEVYDGWLDRLHAAAYSRPRVATVTPLTNCGTICSYPRPDADNFGELEIPWAAVDRLAAEVNARETVESPTAVGFATYVCRAALRELGELDVATFGIGYGEENDFCQRAVKAGWKNLLAADVLVRHFGATSFGGARTERVAMALRALDRLHPRYRRDVQSFATRDPLAMARRRLDLARLTRGMADRAALLVTHARGGGTAQHLQEETARLMAEGWTVFTLSGGDRGPGSARLARAGLGPLPGLAGLDLEGETLWQILGGLKLGRADIHHMIDFPPDAPDLFRRRLAGMGLEYRVTVHDYFAVCPRINMVDHRGRYCGEPAISGCARCLLRRGSVAGRPDVPAWRRRHGALLRGARQVRVPDGDVAQRLGRYFPGLTMACIPHDDARPAARPAAAAAGPPLRIAVIGAIGAIKGFDSVLSLARHCRQRHRPVRLSVIGYTHNDPAARAAGIEVTGAYTNDRAQSLIRAADPHVIWIPSLWPETYCYTLSIAIASGRPVAVFDLGAQAARVARAGCGVVMPLEDAETPGRLLEHLRGAAGIAWPSTQTAA